MKRLLLLLIIFSVSLSSLAQGNPEQRERRENQLKNLKIAYITEQLNLSSDEAEKFWPIYNEHQKNIHQFRKKKMEAYRQKLRDDKSLESITDAEAKDILNHSLELDGNIVREIEAMYSNLESVLSPKKLLKLHQAEGDFNRRVLRELQKERGKRQPR